MRLVNSVLSKDVTLDGILVDVTVEDGGTSVTLALSDGHDRVLHQVHLSYDDARVMAWAFEQMKATVEFGIWNSMVKVATDYKEGESVLTLFHDGVSYSVTFGDHEEFLIRKALLASAERAEENHKARIEESLRRAREVKE